MQWSGIGLKAIEILNFLDRTSTEINQTVRKALDGYRPIQTCISWPMNQSFTGCLFDSLSTQEFCPDDGFRLVLQFVRQAQTYSDRCHIHRRRMDVIEAIITNSIPNRQLNSFQRSWKILL